MPKDTCVNPVFLSLLTEWRDEVLEKKPDSYLAQTLYKAMKSLKTCKEVLVDPRDVQPLPYFGPSITKGLATRYKRLMTSQHEGGNSEDGLSVSISRISSGVTVRDEVEIAPRQQDPSSKKQVIKLPGISNFYKAEPESLTAYPYALIGNGHGTSPGCTGTQSAIDFTFWYLDTDKERVHHRDQAEVVFKNESELWYSIEFPVSQRSHPFISSLKDIRTVVKGEFRMLLALMCEQDVVLREWSNPPQIDPSGSQFPGSMAVVSSSRSSIQAKKVTSLEDELQADVRARFKPSIDPTRQISNLPERDRFKKPTQSESTPSSVFLSSSSSFGSAGLSAPPRAVPSAENARSASMPSTKTGNSISVNATAMNPHLGPSRTYSAPAPWSLPSVDRPEHPLVPPAGTGKKGRRAPRMSSHIPPPPAIDQILERDLDRVPALDIGPQDSQTGDAETPLPFEPIVIPANSYTISLVLDTREVKSTKYEGDRDFIREQIQKHGVCIEQRALELGDVCWIAKRNGMSGTSNEVVLDFILERKRADDLVDSIKDGRFHEQKFRLKESGIGNVYYLVEEYQLGVSHSTMDKAIFTALSSTQIVDGFFLKETRDLSDTIEYLVGLHETILELHQNQPLYVIPPSYIRRHSYSAVQSYLRNSFPAHTYLTTYESHRGLNKAGSVTVRDFFARMLLCINGMSAEKCSNIIGSYDTPLSLWQAFIAAEEEEAKDRQKEAEDLGGVRGGRRCQVIPARYMLTRLPGTGRRHIGEALSTKIYEIFRGSKY